MGKTRNDISNLFHCPKVKKKTGACQGVLVPYKIEFIGHAERYDAFTRCTTCRTRYKFPLYWDEKSRWLYPLKKVFRDCPECGMEDLEIEDRKGKNQITLKFSCGRCGKSTNKRIRKVLLNQLEREDDVVQIDDEAEKEQEKLEEDEGVLIEEVEEIEEVEAIDRGAGSRWGGAGGAGGAGDASRGDVSSTDNDEIVILEGHIDEIKPAAIRSSLGPETSVAGQENDRDDDTNDTNDPDDGGGDLIKIIDD
ncbi:MAG: hypothetical protein ACTSUE_25865 [Promethearchaeota archaeon]